MAFIKVFTYAVTEADANLGLLQNPEKLATYFSPSQVAYIEESNCREEKGSVVVMVNGESFYTEHTPAELVKMIEQATQNEFYPKSN